MTKRPFHKARLQNDLFDKIVSENEAFFISAEEWLYEGWQICEANEATPELAAAVILMAANDAQADIDRDKPATSPGYPAWLRTLAFKCLNASGHSPGPVVVNIFGGLVQGVFSDSPVEVVIVDWDQDGVTDDDMKNGGTLFKWDGKIGSAYDASCIPLGHLEPETWYALACALSTEEERPQPTNETIKNIMEMTGQTH